MECVNAVCLQEVSNVIWSYAKMGVNPAPGFLTDVAAIFLKQISVLKAQELSSALWAFATFRFYPGDALMDCAASECVR